MSKSWLEWVEENLERNCDPQGIVDILREHQFSMPAIRNMMGNRFPESAAQESTSKASQPLDIERLHLKRESLLKIQRKLAKLSAKSLIIDRRDTLTGDAFLEDYYALNKPVIITGIMKSWAAQRKWTAEYLKATCGREMVEIMAARESNPLYEIEDGRHRKTVPFGDFVDSVMNGPETNDYYLTARNNFFTRESARQLLADIEIFPQYLKQDRSGNGIFFWFGPKGTITPLHHDPINVIMAQVRGRKHIKLIPPNDLDIIYNHYSVYSLVDAAKPDLDSFPEFAQARISEVELAPGEALFLPVGWWHYVKSLDTSMTVTFINFLFPNEFEWVHPLLRA